MSTSSAYKVAYDLRPSKQTERRILLDVLKFSSEFGLKCSTYQYLGFGGFKFYDFEMLFRHFGISDMISLEIDNSIYPRCRFNKPFGFIKTKCVSLGDYLEDKSFRKPLIAWLDYDCSLQRSVIDDLLLIGTKAPIGSFVFATIDARLPEAWLSFGAKKRLSILKAELEGFALDPNIRDVQAENFPIYAEKVIWAALLYGLSRHPSATFVPLLRLFYKDTAPMITVGGLLCRKPDAERYSQEFLGKFPFVGDLKQPYTIQAFNITMRERSILDTVVTDGYDARKLRRRAREIGMDRKIIDDYKYMMRFVPRYFESYL